ncbi:hypothetical protein SAMN05444007_105225 [Cribrihabitans marinus]|uniref:Uncharacterized protein n=1 Tax=Cribrihabitans marinus TaxID=1227549 RepID=A0A1H6ZR43_9RHOB|nr:hypothetical protein GCM10010973_20110 [Cribrihabitans marinus]SEJ55821.1 hypothetical protein SAMN05444007_105225 [Cribrihabitans marinus]
MRPVPGVRPGMWLAAAPREEEGRCRWCCIRAREEERPGCIWCRRVAGIWCGDIREEEDAAAESRSAREEARI